MNIQDTPKSLVDSVISILQEKKKKYNEVDEPRSKGEKDFKNSHNTKISQFVEKLDPKAPAEKWIEDFIKSDAPQFKGKDKEKRIQMALAARSAAREKAGLSEDNLQEAPSDQWIELLGKAISKNSNKPEFGKAADELEDWAVKYNRTWKELSQRGGVVGKLFSTLAESLDIRPEFFKNE